jgi:hypothetical protein
MTHLLTDIKIDDQIQKILSAGVIDADILCALLTNDTLIYELIYELHSLDSINDFFNKL